LNFQLFQVFPVLGSFIKIGNRTLAAVLECMAVLLFLLAVLFGVFIWKLSEGPISLGFAKEYITDALGSQQDGVAVAFDDIVLSWPEMRGPFLMNVSGLQIRKGESDVNSLRIDRASIGLSRRALMFGHIRPVSVIIMAPSLELVRTEEGSLTLFLKEDEGGNKRISVDEMSGGQPPVHEGSNNRNDIVQLFKDMAHKKRGSWISRLRAFEIRGASVAVRDYKFGLSWYLTDLDFMLSEHPQGVAAALVVALPGGSRQSASVALDMVYRKEMDDFKAAAHIQDVNPYIISRFLPVPDEVAGQDLYFTGEMELAMDSAMVPVYAKFSGEVPEGSIHLPEEYDAPIELRNIILESEYNAADKSLSISRLSGDIGGVVFEGKADAMLDQDSLRLPLSFAVGKVAINDIAELIPKSERDGDAYEWLGLNIEGATGRDVTGELLLTVDRIEEPQTNSSRIDVDVPELKIDFSFEGGKVTYSDTLMPAENASGRGHFDLAAELLEITDARAMLGEIEGTDVTVKATDLMVSGAGYVTVKTKIKGPLAGALEYIAAEPIGMDKNEIGIDAAAVKGAIEAEVEVGLPTLKDLPKEEVNVSVKGILSDIEIPAVVEGLALSGGPLEMATEPGGFKIKGHAKLAGRDTELDWHQFFSSEGNPYSMRVEAKLGADKELRNHFGVDLDDYISGTMPVSVVYTDKGKGDASVEVQGDLAPVRIHIDPFRYAKPQGVAGTISATAILKDDVLKELRDIELATKDLSAGKAAIKFAPMNGKKADLSSGNLPNISIGKTQMALTFNVTEGNVMNIKADGPVFDLAPFLQEAEASGLYADAPKEKQQPMKIAMTASTMLAANGQKTRNTKTYLELDDEGDITRIEYDAGIGDGNIFIRFMPDGTGKRIFRLETNDAGATLDGFGLYEDIEGGSLLIYGEPPEGDRRGNLHGTMRMENFRVVRAPALARLLSLMSLTGLQQLLGNQGLVFSKLESGFEWRFRPEGNLLIIKDGSTSGSSIGLTFAGTADRGKKTTDVAGTIIPMTEVNSLLSQIPLVGEILGGSSGLIAATYTMKGPSGDPQISVNPLSVLAPGILRRILFEGGFSQRIPGEEEAMSGKAAPAQEPAGQRRAPRTAGPQQ